MEKKEPKMERIIHAPAINTELKSGFAHMANGFKEGMVGMQETVKEFSHTISDMKGIIDNLLKRIKSLEEDRISREATITTLLNTLKWVLRGVGVFIVAGIFAMFSLHTSVIRMEEMMKERINSKALFNLDGSELRTTLFEI